MTDLVAGWLCSKLKTIFFINISGENKWEIHFKALERWVVTVAL